MLKKIILFCLTLQNFILAINSDVPFHMLKSNRIGGLIPHITDIYGVTFRDFNNDGYPDLYLVSFRNLNRLLINNGGIIPFIDRTIASGLGGYLMTKGKSNFELGSSSADYNNDGLADIFLAGWGKTAKLFLNSDNLRFSDVTANLNMEGVSDANQALWFDADNDGNLDLYITDEHSSNRFFLNKGNGFFKETLWTESFLDTANSQGGCVSDFDSDGDMDLYIANWYHPDYLLLNDGTGLFTRVDQSLPTLQNPFLSNSASAADLDNDGDSDLIVTTKESGVFYYLNQSVNNKLSFKLVAANPFTKMDENVFGALLEDFNNDGWLDCFFTIDGNNRLYINNKNGRFSTVFDSDRQNFYSTGSAAADLEGDGDLDIFVANKNGLNQIYLNPTNKDNSISLKLIGINSNRDAIGAKLFFYTADSLRQFLGMREVSAQKAYLSSGPLTVHFGLGNADGVWVDAVFPNGSKISNRLFRAGQTEQVYEYKSGIRHLFQMLNTIRFYTTHPDFFVNLSFIIVFVAFLWIYIFLGFRRYEWQALTLSLNFLALFLIMILSFIVLKEFKLTNFLIAINSILFVLILISLLFFEYYHLLRNKHNNFRTALHALSGHLIQIYENQEVYQELSRTIKMHSAVSKCMIFIQDPESNIFKNFKDARELSLLPGHLKVLSTNNYLSTKNYPELDIIFKTHKINILIPVKKGEELFAIIALNILDYSKILYMEDLRLMVTLSNQAAITLENNKYMDEKAKLSAKLTEAKIREEYLKELEDKNLALDRYNKELKILFAEIQQKEAQLVHSEKMASLGQLVAGISHELNNPISFIYANSKALETYIEELQVILKTGSIKGVSEDMNQRLHNNMEDIQDIIHDNLKGSKAVKELVLNLKNFSRIDQAEWKKAYPLEGLDSSLKMLKPELGERIDVELVYNVNPEIYCNPGQLNQIFINLISNAAHSISGKGRIRIESLDDKEYLIIKIEDNGQGIKKEHIKKIFDPFFTTKDINRGTGLGLSITYKIIQNHNGKIEVESEPDKGTIFTLYLPLNEKPGQES